MTQDPFPTRTETAPGAEHEPLRPPPGVAAAHVVVPAAPRRRGPLDYLLGAALVLAIGGVAFAVGRGTAPAAAPSTIGGLVPGGAVTIGPDGSFDPSGLQGGGPGGIALGGPTVEGTVTAIDADSMTIRLPDGDEIEIALQPDTTYHQATETDPTAVAVGDDVSVRAEGGRPIVVGGPGPSAQVGAPAFTADDVTVRR